MPSKIVVDTIQKNGGPAIKLPAAAGSNGQILASNTADPTELVFLNKPADVSADGGISSSSLPIIFARNVGYQQDNTGNYGWSSELGDWRSSGSIPTIASITLGRTYYNAANNGNYANYYFTPRLEFIQGTTGRFCYTQHDSVYADSSNRYTYPDKMLSLMFIKNTTAANITSTFSSGGSSYSTTYGGAQVYTLTPNANNTAIAANTSVISSITQTQAWTYSTTNANYIATTSITIPADTTIGIGMFTSGKYHTSYSQSYNLHMRHEIYNFTSFLTAGLVVDVPRTLRALQNPNKLAYDASTNGADIWK